MSIWFVELLVLAVMVVNGWTDAPNAIASVVSTGTLSFRRAVVLAAVCDFLGGMVMFLLCPAVARTVLELTDLGGAAEALTALQGTLLAIVLWSVVAWRFGLPTSESHALLAGLTGAGAAIHGGLGGVNAGAWGKVLAGLALSTACGALSGAWTRRQLEKVWLSPKLVRRGQLMAAGATAFFHGAQDGQKFTALFLLCRGLGRGEMGGDAMASLPVCVLCAGCMAAGTAIGGRRIIDTVTRDLDGLTPRAALAADLGSGVCLLAASVLGLPVSTTHTKLSALWGAGRGGEGHGAAGEIVLAWLATFPVCFSLAWALTRLMAG